MKAVIWVIGWLLTPFLFVFWMSIALIPETRVLRLARSMGIFLRRRSRKRTIQKMKAVLGTHQWGDADWMNFWVRHAEQAALMIIELVHLHKMPATEMHHRITVEGEDHIRKALESHRGVMLFVNHLGNLAGTVSHLALQGYDITLAGNPVWIPFLEKKIGDIHTKIGAHRVHIGNNLPQIASNVFRRNGIFATFIDFSVTPKHTTWITFGQANLRVNLGPAILALRHKVDVVYATCTRLPGNRHHVVIRPLHPVDIDGDIHAGAEKLMQQAIARVETDLFEHPEQWWPWNYARVRSRESQENVPSAAAQARH